MLNKFYFINKFQKSIIDLQDKYTTIIYRNYKEKLKIKEIIQIRNYCKKRNLKFFLSNNIKLSIKLKLDGSYIPSFNRNTNHLSYKFKKNINYLGINKFKLISYLSRKKIIALGGISSENIRYIKLTNAVGFSGISYFNKKKAP